MPKKLYFRIFLSSILLTICFGCVSKSDFEEIQSENQDLLTQLKKVERARAILQDQLNTREMQDIGNLQDQLDNCILRIEDGKESCEQRTAEAQKAGYFQGAAEFNSSLQVVGFPRTNGWWIFSSNYYIFQVRLRGETLYSVQVETENEEPELLQGVALVKELAPLLKAGA